MGEAAADPVGFFLDPLGLLPDVIFLAPERIWLGVPVVAILVLAPLVRRGAGRPRPLPFVLRAAALLALLAVLLDPVVPRPHETDARLLVLADVSPSIGEAGLDEAQAYLAQARSAFDLVAFGAAPELIGEGVRAPALRPDPRPRTDLAQALRLAAVRAARDEQLRVVLLSDGRATEAGVDDAVLHLRRTGVRVFVQPIPSQTPDRAPGVRALGIDLPPPADRRRRFTLTAHVGAEDRTRVTATLYLDGKPHARSEAELAQGEGEIAFTGLELPPGRYFAQVLLEGDTEPDDNLASAALEVPGTPRVLLFAARERRALLADALNAQGIEAQVAAPAASIDLDGFDAVVLLPDAPPRDLDARTASLADFVGRRGGGLLAIGGLEGPGLARLHGTPTAQLLPLEVAARPEPATQPPAPEPGRTPRTEIIEETTQAYPITLCLVVDRSGSMEGRKMQQAKAAAAAAAHALTDADRIAVVSFGDEARVDVQPRRAGDASAIVAALSGLEAGGRTAMFHALAVAYDVLRRETNPIRHLVLISDGMPTDDGRWKDMITTMAGEKVTLSAVGIGFNINTVMLGSFAKWGKGMYWAANRPHEVPQVVTQDTLRVVQARDRRGRDTGRTQPPAEPEPAPPAEEPAPPTPPPSLPILADPGAPREMLKGIPDGELPEVAGVEEGEPRFASWIAARAGEGGPPLLAYRRVGLGTAAALMVDPEAPGAAALREHAEFPRLVAQLLRSVLPDARGEPFLVEVDLAGDRLLLRVTGEDGLQRTDLPVEVRVDGRMHEVRRRAGGFEVSLPDSGATRTVEAAIGSAGAPLMVRRFVAPPSRLAELAETGIDRAALARLARGADHVDRPANETLIAAGVKTRRPEPLSLPFLLLAAILLPLDAWARRRARSASR